MLDHFRIKTDLNDLFWALGHFGPFRTIKGHFKPFRTMSDCLGAFQFIYSHFKSFETICEPFWTILSHCRSFWSILNHFRPSWVCGGVPTWLSWCLPTIGHHFNSLVLPFVQKVWTLKNGVIWHVRGLSEPPYSPLGPKRPWGIISFDNYSVIYIKHKFVKNTNMSI
jgi:hypothetical protein